MSEVGNCSDKQQTYSTYSKPVEHADATRVKTPVFMDKIDILKESCLSDKNFMDDIKYKYPFPDWAADMVPEEILLLSSSRGFLVNESTEEAIANLPKKPDGSVDVEKVQQALKIAVEHIKKSNEKALEALNHGIYAQQANDGNILGQVFGPETVALLEWVGFDVAQFNTEFSLHKTDVMGWFVEDMHVKDSSEIENNIRLQNAQLDELLKLDLNNPENLERFITGYKNTTGTTFSVDRIMASQDKNLSKEAKLQKSVASFGLQENLIESFKNKTASDAWFGAVKGVVSAILTNSPNPIAKIIGNILPYHMELVELAAQGRKDGELINTDNLTFANLTRAFLNATKNVVVNNVPFAGGAFLRILQRCGINLSNLGVNAGVGAVTS